MLTIGKLASLTHVSNDTLRYYEHEGLLEPAGKSRAGYRLYNDVSAKRIHFIKQAQQCGFTLSQIRELLLLRSRDAACCGDVPKRAIAKKLQIEDKIKAMKAMSKALDQLIADCTNEKKPVRECSIMEALERANMADRVRRIGGKPEKRN